MEPAERMRALLRYANYTHVALGLTEAGYPVSAATVSRWAQGRNVTAMTVSLVEDLLAETQKNAPAWAEALADDVAMKIIAALAPVDRWQAAMLVIERLAELQQPADDSPRGADSPPDPAAPMRLKPEPG